MKPYAANADNEIPFTTSDKRYRVFQYSSTKEFTRIQLQVSPGRGEVSVVTAAHVSEYFKYIALGIGWSSSTSLLPVSDDVGFLTMGAQRTSRVHRGFDKGKRKHSNAFKLININCFY